ncbi:MAG: replication factor C large subunit [archaeon]|jgi:replication factor C large subunit
MKSFFDKYTPKSLDEVVGNKPAIETIKQWSKEHKKPLFIYGAPGIGKTLVANLLAKENKWTILNTDASDLRDKDVIKSLFTVACTSNTLFGTTRLVLIDEIDSIADKKGGEDFGFFSEFEKIIEKSIQPIIFIANDPYENKKIRPLFEKCEQVKFDLPHKPSILKFAKDICEKENIEYDVVSLGALIENSSNDIRATMIDLYTLSFSGKITLEDTESVGGRKKDEDVFKVLQKIFYPKDFFETRNVTDSMNIDRDFLLLWIEENIPRQYKNSNNLARAFDNLSKADINNARIRGNNWVLLKYVIDYLTVGVAYSRKDREPPSSYTPFQFPRVMRMYTSKDKNLQKAIVEKLKVKMHCSKRIILRDYLPFIFIIAKTNKCTKDLITYYDLTVDELKYLGAKITEKQFEKLING